MPFLGKTVSADGKSAQGSSSAFDDSIAGSSDIPPPSYAVHDPNITLQNSQDLNAAFTSLRLTAQPLPFPESDHCLAHLKLLAAFNALKRDVGHTDGLFDIEDRKVEKVENKRAALDTLKEKRWSLYIARAVERFEAWWLKVLVPRERAERLTCAQLATDPAIRSFAERAVPQAWTSSMLPPLGQPVIFLFYQC